MLYEIRIAQKENYSKRLEQMRADKAVDLLCKCVKWEFKLQWDNLTKKRRSPSLIEDVSRHLGVKY